MSLSVARSYFRTMLESLGFEEWKDPFRSDNVPNTLLDRSFQISSPTASGVSLNLTAQFINFEQRVSIFRRGRNTPTEAEDEIIEDIQDILCLTLKASNRGVDKVNVFFEGFTIEPLNTENEHSVKATLTFNVQVALSVN